MTTNRPNIIYFHSHDTGRYVQPYGYACPSPNYQRLAEQGTLFRQAFNAAPTCSPSRAALLTGQSPHASGMLGLAHRGFQLNDSSQHIATALRDAGYRTMLAGVQHVTTGDPRELGYIETTDGKDRSTESISQTAVEMLGRLAESREPFFLDVGFSDTHRVFPEIDQADARYVRPPHPIPDSPETRLDTARYLASLRRLDAALGTVLDTLEATNLRESTLVICTTDHGLAFPNMKCNLTDHGTGVLLILSGPRIEQGEVTDAMVSHLDLYPTICELLEIERPAWLTGTSLWPVLHGEQTEVNEAIFAEVTYHAAYEPQRAIRTPEWTYIRRFGDRSLPVLPNCDDGESRDYLFEHGWDQRELPSEQLYHNIFDPNQVANIVNDPTAASALADLRSRLETWMEETNDPLLDGPVPLPVGAVANDPDSRSFSEPLIEGLADGTTRLITNPQVNA